MPCCFYGYGRKTDACAVRGRCQQASGKPEDTTCPHGGDGTRCKIVQEKVAASNEVAIPH